MPMCYKCGMQNPKKSYRCIYDQDGAKITVLLCANCVAIYPFTHVLDNVLSRSLLSLVRDLPMIEAMQPTIIDNTEEEGEYYALWAIGILIAIVLSVAAITIVAGWLE